MSRELFAGELPIVLVPAGGSARESENVPPTMLTVALALSPSDTLFFSVAEFRDRLFKYTYQLTALNYAVLRVESQLRVEFAAFPALFADMLARVCGQESRQAARGTCVRAEDDLVAFLELPDFATNKPPEFEVMVHTSVGLASQIKLALTVSSELVVCREIAARLKLAEADVAATEARAIAEAARAAAGEAAARERDAVTAAHASCDRDLDRARRTAEEASERIEQQDVELRDLRARAEENEDLRERLDATMADLQGMSSARDRLIDDLAESRAAEVSVTHKLTAAIAELHKGNSMLAGLRKELRIERRNAAVAMAVCERQEKALDDGETKIAELQRELRRTRDRLEMVVLERDGMVARLASARKTMENDKVLIEKDRKKIAYLNKELNRAAMALDVRRGRGLSPSDYDSTSTLSDSLSPYDSS